MVSIHLGASNTELEGEQLVVSEFQEVTSSGYLSDPPVKIPEPKGARSAAVTVLSCQTKCYQNFRAGNDPW